jgi:hypothetical protein
MKKHVEPNGCRIMQSFKEPKCNKKQNSFQACILAWFTKQWGQGDQMSVKKSPKMLPSRFFVKTNTYMYVTAENSSLTI